MAVSNLPRRTAPGARYEGTYIFMKGYVCPVCDSKLSVPTVMTGKARMAKQDWDLRPIFTDIDTIKYDVIHCNNCGYAVLKRYSPVSESSIAMKFERCISSTYLKLLNAFCI